MGTQNKIAQSHEFLRALTAVAFVAGMACVVAPATAEGWYSGASLGKTEDRSWCKSTPTGCDGKDNGWKIFAGNQVNDFFAYEFGYTDLGERTNATTTIETSGVVANLVGMIPVGDMFSLSLRVGSLYWHTDISSTNPANAGKNDHASLHLGLGIHVPLGKRFTARVELERYDVNPAEIRLISVGLAYNFGK